MILLYVIKFATKIIKMDLRDSENYSLCDCGNISKRIPHCSKNERYFLKDTEPSSVMVFFYCIFDLF